MQEIFILVGDELFGNKNFMEFLGKYLGKTDEEAFAMLYGLSNEEDYSLRMRTDKEMQDAFLDMYPNTEYKILEIPDGVKWHIETYECAIGEFVCEDYRIWE